MTLTDISNSLNADILTGETVDELNVVPIATACGCDLMSDVLAFLKNQSLLLTGLINSQVIRTAEMMDIVAVCFVRGKSPAEDVIRLAKEKGIILIKTDLPLYSACGILYKNGLGGTSHA